MENKLRIKLKDQITDQETSESCLNYEVSFLNIEIRYSNNVSSFRTFSFHLTIAAFRRAPDSFTDQRYYTWLAFEYKAKDSVPRYAKFRIVPADGRPETGLMTEQEQRTPW